MSSCKRIRQPKRIHGLGFGKEGMTRGTMVRGSRRLLFKDAAIVADFLSNVLVCPLSKNPLSQSRESQSLISNALGVLFPIVDGIPCLVPKDGKLVEHEGQDAPKYKSTADSSTVKNES